MIKRDTYIKRLEMYAGRSIVKFITGVRRSGKTTVIRQFIDDLKDSGVSEDNIIYIDFEGVLYSCLEQGSDLKEILTGFLEGSSEHRFIFLDEMKNFRGWSRILAELMLLYDCEFFVSTSSQTIFRENYKKDLEYRYVWIPVYPLSFSEFIEYASEKENYAGLSRPELLREFVRIGAMPGALELEDSARRVYLRDMCGNAVLRDVVASNSLRDVNHIDKILNYLMLHVGETFSPKALKDYIKAQGITISVDTVYSILRALIESGLVYRVPRFDIKTGRILETQEKYYFCDVAMRSAVLGDDEIQFDRCMENLLYIELLSRGFKVFVGKLGGVQIDFVAMKNDDRTYLNVCEYIDANETVKREFSPLVRIHDNYFKMVLTMDEGPKVNKGGIINYPLAEFLAQC